MNINLIVTAYLIAVNLIAFLVIGMDKRKAKRNEWRIPEKVLFLFPLLGGALGGVVGMFAFHHKTKHWYFRIGFPVILVLQTIALAFFWFVGDYYRADGVALESLRSSDRVQVSLEGETYFFDGPGEDTALVFYPGGKVEYTAYAPLLHRIAAGGADCFLVKMPFNLAVFGSDRAEQVMEAHDYERWYLSGHSLGGTMAASCASEHLDELDGLILLGAYPTGPLKRDGFSVLSVYGSEDFVVNREKLRAGADHMPEDYTELCIDGGNHAWFGSYGEQAKDGRATVSHEEQWTQTTDAVLAMVLK